MDPLLFQKLIKNIDGDKEALSNLLLKLVTIKNENWETKQLYTVNAQGQQKEEQLDFAINNVKERISKLSESNPK
jgi:hypothetical protein